MSIGNKSVLEDAPLKGSLPCTNLIAQVVHKELSEEGTKGQSPREPGDSAQTQTPALSWAGSLLAMLKGYLWLCTRIPSGRA